MPDSVPSDQPLRTRVDANPAQVGRARRLLRDRLDGWGVSGDPSDVALLLTSELLTNAILHGTPPLTLVATVTGRRVRVEVHDGDARSASRVGQRRLQLLASDSSPGGRGLTLVAALSTRWGTSSSGRGKYVWFELDVA